MSERDYENLFNDIMVQTRERRRTLKETLDRIFDEDAAQTSEVLSEMLRVNDKAYVIDSSRQSFMGLISVMKQVRASRQDLIERIDKLMDEVRRFLALKEELANDRLEKLTVLFREELGNRDFKFQFHLLDDQELHHLSELRTLARRDLPADDRVVVEPPRATPVPPVEPPVRSVAPPPPPPVEQSEPASEPADWMKQTVVTEPEPAPWAPSVDEKPSWLTSAQLDMTAPPLPPPPRVAVPQVQAPAPASEPAPEAEPAAGEAGGNPYEVDVDVLRILSEETFRSPKRPS